MEKVSSYFPLPSPPLPSPRTPPLQYSPPSTLPIPDPLLPLISLITIARAVPWLCLCLPNPLAHRVHPSLPPLLLFPCVVCRIRRRSLDFCCEPHFDLCTYAALSLPILRSRLSRFASLPPSLRMQCHISFVTSPNYPFVFCNHSFSFSLSLHSLVTFVHSDDRASIRMGYLFFSFLVQFSRGPALHHP